MGDIKLASVDGFGTDAYIYLQVSSPHIVDLFLGINVFRSFFVDHLRAAAVEQRCGEPASVQLRVQGQADEHRHSGQTRLPSSHNPAPLSRCPTGLTTSGRIIEP